jgi:hypothetical protein
MNLETITLHQEEAANMADLIKTLKKHLTGSGRTASYLSSSQRWKISQLLTDQKINFEDWKDFLSNGPGCWDLFWWSG